MPNNLKVFSEAIADGSSSVVEVLSSVNDSTPATPSVACHEGMIYVCLSNNDTGSCKVNLEWSPDNLNWFAGVEIGSGDTDTVINVRDRLDTPPPSTDATGFDTWAGTVDASSTQAQAFKVKGQYARLTIAGKSGNISIDAWIGSV